MIVLKNAELALMENEIADNFTKSLNFFSERLILKINPYQTFSDFIRLIIVTAKLERNCWLLACLQLAFYQATILVDADDGQPWHWSIALLCSLCLGSVALFRLVSGDTTAFGVTEADIKQNIVINQNLKFFKQKSIKQKMLLVDKAITFTACLKQFCQFHCY